MGFSDIGYSGQRLNNHSYRMKVRVGDNIHNATGDAVCGEIFLVTGASPTFYIATATSTETTSSVYSLPDFTSAAWTTHSFASLVDTPLLMNSFVLGLQPEVDIPAGTPIKIIGLAGVIAADGALSFEDAGANQPNVNNQSHEVFKSPASSVVWDSATSTVTLTPDEVIPAASLSTVSFILINGPTAQTAISTTLSAAGMVDATLSPVGAIVAGSISNAISDSMVTVTDNATLLAMPPPAAPTPPGPMPIFYTPADMRLHFYDHTDNVWRFFQFLT